MFEIQKTFEIAGSHKLKLDYDSPCQQLHGHNWIITVFLRTNALNENGMVLDFKEIKERIHSKLDHKYFNDIFDFNPTAENIAKWIYAQLPFCYKVKVQESENNIAVYREDI